MKPRLKVAPYTAEDCAIWRRVHANLSAIAHPENPGAHSDRRDAEQMHALKHHDVHCDVCWRGMPGSWRVQGLEEAKPVRIPGTLSFKL
jgi:hypothetical protein